MTTETIAGPIFTDWTRAHTEGWASRPLMLTHRLNRDPLFSREGLAELVSRYPREHYALIYMGAQGQSEKRFWREGDIAGLSGEKVITSIEAGRMWLNLRRVSEVDRRYREVVDQIFEEVRAHVPGYETFSRTCGILISSPNAQVYYHSDLPGQSLWQMHGRKRVYVYPDQPPYLHPEQLEHIALNEVEVDMRYEPSFDKGALVFDLEPGQMLHWQLNAPHRVENHDCLNVSMTTEYWTADIRRRQMLNLANGILRERLGLAPRSRATSGPAFWAKAVLQAGMRRAGLLERNRKSVRPIDFRLDPAEPGRIIDLGAPA